MASLFPTQTLVLRNVHDTSSDSTIYYILKHLANVPRDVIDSIVFWPLKYSDTYELDAFVRFKTIDKAVDVGKAIGGRSHRLLCPLPPPPGRLNRVVDIDGNRVSRDAAIKNNTLCFTDVYIAMWGGFNGKADLTKLSKKAWVCLMCGLPNYPRRVFCYRCNAIDPSRLVEFKSMRPENT